MKKILIGVLILCLALLAGCWDSREMNELGLVMAVGIDKAPDSNDYIVTAQIANEKATAQQGSSGGSESESIYIASAQGQTLFDAVRALSKAASKRIMWAHNYIVIIGESVARDSIMPVVDFFTHNPELRLKTAVVVSEGDAKNYLAIKSGMEDIPGISFSDIYEFGWLTGEYFETNMLALSQSLYSAYKQPVLSKISFSQSRLMPDESLPAETVEQVEFGGSAVFNKDKMLGWLTPDETRGLAWVMNQTRDTVVSVEEPSHPGRYVSVEMHSVSAQIIANVNNGQPSITIEIKGTGDISEENAGTSLPMEEFKKTIAGLVAQKNVNDISTSLNKIQGVYKSDVLGLANVIHGQHNYEWENGIKQRWQEVYPQLPITINVNVTITDSTLFQTPAQELQKY